MADDLAGQIVALPPTTEEFDVKQLVAVSVLAAVAVVGPVTAASADPEPSTNGCQTVAHKYLDEDAPGHVGVSHAAEQGKGEGPCGFGSPPGHEDSAATE